MENIDTKGTVSMRAVIPMWFHIGSAYMGILFWGNMLTASARWRGVTPTVRMITWMASRLPATRGEFGHYSGRIDALLKNVPFLFVAHRQKCLIRGLLLFFFGKRRKLDVQLHFGSKIDHQKFNTHCWIVLDGKIHFEVDDVIRQYTTLIEYS
jgi:hypothetical protein